MIPKMRINESSVCSTTIYWMIDSDLRHELCLGNRYFRNTVKTKDFRISCKNKFVLSTFMYEFPSGISFKRKYIQTNLSKAINHCQNPIN